MAIGNVMNPIEQVGQDPSPKSIGSPKDADKAKDSGTGMVGGMPGMSPTPPSPSMGENTRPKGRGTI